MFPSTLHLFSLPKNSHLIGVSAHMALSQSVYPNPSPQASAFASLSLSFPHHITWVFFILNFKLCICLLSSSLEYQLLGERNFWLFSTCLEVLKVIHCPSASSLHSTSSALYSGRLNYSKATMGTPDLGLQSAPMGKSGKRLESLGSYSSLHISRCWRLHSPLIYLNSAHILVNISLINLSSYYSSNSPSGFMPEN